MTIILVGAFSKFVNQLDDGDFTKPKTKELLEALRVLSSPPIRVCSNRICSLGGNLKLAIDYGLQSAQSDLISSFIMSEHGDGFTGR